MQVEVTLPNRDGALLPGAFVQVELPLRPSGSLLVAASGSLTFPSMGTEFPQPATIRGTDVYQCRITYTLAAVNYVSDPFMLACQRFPA